MSEIITFTLDFEADLDQYLKEEHPEVVDFRLLSESLDARKANRGRRPKIQYRIEVIERGEKFTPWEEVFQDLGELSKKPVIIGAGPAGLFCALRLVEYGIPSVILERGSPANERMKHIARFWRYGEFDSENNVCFGEEGPDFFLMENLSLGLKVLMFNT